MKSSRGLHPASHRELRRLPDTNTHSYRDLLAIDLMKNNEDVPGSTLNRVDVAHNYTRHSHRKMDLGTHTQRRNLQQRKATNTIVRLPTWRTDSTSRKSCYVPSEQNLLMTDWWFLQSCWTCCEPYAEPESMIVRPVASCDRHWSDFRLEGQPSRLGGAN